MRAHGWADALPGNGLGEQVAWTPEVSFWVFKFLRCLEVPNRDSRIKKRVLQHSEFSIEGFKKLDCDGKILHKKKSPPRFSGCPAKNVLYLSTLKPILKNTFVTYKSNWSGALFARSTNEADLRSPTARARSGEKNIPKQIYVCHIINAYIGVVESGSM